MMTNRIYLLSVTLLINVFCQLGFGATKLEKYFAHEAAVDEGVAALTKEVGKKGWIVYSSPFSKNGSWDLFLSRPDGTQRRNITNTPDFEEAGPRFSPDSRKILYRRITGGKTVNHDKWGSEGCLVMADADGGNPKVFANEGEFAWASWSPDGKQIGYLTIKGVEIFDFARGKIVRNIPRQGMYSMLYWSPDGQYFCGVANHFGEVWTIATLNVSTGELLPVHKFQNCTPDWFPDSQHIIFSYRPKDQPAGKGYGWTQLWMADRKGKKSRLIFGEDGFHIYGGALSPDGKYVLFSKCKNDGGGAKEKTGAPIYIMRLADAPIIQGESKDLRKLHAQTNDGPVLKLAVGWEPCWSYAEIGAKK